MNASPKPGPCSYIFAACLCGIPAANAQVECWAPGMSGSVVLTSSAGSKSVSLGKPYRYDVFGVGGTLELGGLARDATVVNGIFKQKYLIGTGGTVTSKAYVMLQTGLLNTYPEQLTVSGNSPAMSVGPLLKYGTNWTLSDPKHPANVNLTFHQSGSSLLGSLLPGLLEPPYANLNPKGTFYVLGEYHATPPVMTGTLDVSTSSVLSGCSVGISYTINRQETSTYRPPLLGLILGDSNVTVLGTPPPTATPPVGTSHVTVTIDPNQLAVSINLNASQGPGWKKTTVAP